MNSTKKKGLLIFHVYAADGEYHVCGVNHGKEPLPEPVDIDLFVKAGTYVGEFAVVASKSHATGATDFNFVGRDGKYLSEEMGFCKICEAHIKEVLIKGFSGKKTGE